MKVFDQTDIEQKDASDKNTLSQKEQIEVFDGLSEHCIISDAIQKELLDFEPDFQTILKEELTKDVIDTSLKEDEDSNN
ncbi:hypothetical protein GJ496_001463 [Pomphorhynchus laevis]|nr:hypothetical protein GJ496_001463 [Pomphorhynchus laevis]